MYVDRVIVRIDNGVIRAVSPQRAKREFGIEPTMIYERKDGWRLGAPKQFIQNALNLYYEDWVDRYKRFDLAKGIYWEQESSSFGRLIPDSEA